MKRISSNHSPLPSLAIRARSLAPDASSRIAAALVAPPAAQITGTFWGVIELLHGTLTAFDFEGLDGVTASSKKRAILNNVELLMHRCSAMNDYLGKLLYAALPSSDEKNKRAYATKKRLDYRIEQLYKMPINLIKHNSFGMSWIEMEQGLVKTHGYCVTGPVGDQLYAPVKFRAKDAGSPEGYSFALTLRESLLALFEMADIAEEALSDADLFGDQAKDDKSKDIRESVLPETLMLLNDLPLNGFPDEHRIRVPIFSLEQNAISITTKPLRMLPGTFRIHTELRTVTAGMTYKLPYFQGST